MKEIIRHDKSKHCFVRKSISNKWLFVIKVTKMCFNCFLGC
ncbi:hypothetical protein PALI_a3461 [Pseudoalteromonas aliena SW19]|uniref:Uncharacterized protein n=1 Tax=Pseudoalteromonas aliena SW19 TaxID=1314866 RepID=A0ABR9DTZ2_9GAMM|nr:hypothetical protein [Pseudoalteromonas aliena SW19]